MTLEEFKEIIHMFWKEDLRIKAFPDTRLINAQDCDGVWQSFYVSTGTAIFRDGNDKYKSRRVVVRNMPLQRFIDLCKDNSEDDIQEIYFD